MRMVVGGAFQGKLGFAKKELGIKTGWIDGDTCAFSDIYSCNGIVRFQQYIKRMLQSNIDTSILAEKLIERNPDICIVTNEIGYGLVPTDPFDRMYREQYGRVCQTLAAASSEVYVVVCGIGKAIKHD